MVRQTDALLVDLHATGLAVKPDISGLPNA
jgi:hypothetical protein